STPGRCAPADGRKTASRNLHCGRKSPDGDIVLQMRLKIQRGLRNVQSGRINAPTSEPCETFQWQRRSQTGTLMKRFLLAITNLICASIAAGQTPDWEGHVEDDTVGRHRPLAAAPRPTISIPIGAKIHRDGDSDPLPFGAVLRFGSVRMRQDGVT